MVKTVEGRVASHGPPETGGKFGSARRFTIKGYQERFASGSKRERERD